MEFYINNRKSFPSTTGVYSITFKNSTSNKKYIGSASTCGKKHKSENGFYTRWTKHINDLIANRGTNLILQNAFNKYGLTNIVFNILEECTPDKCIERENFYINLYDTYNNGYNASAVAEKGNVGFTHSDKTKQQISDFYKTQRKTQFEQIFLLHEQGYSIVEICKQTKISHTTVRKIIKENNIYVKKEATHIFQYDLLGNFINEWPSIYDCSKKLDIHWNTIDHVLKKKSTHARNFYFSYEKLNTDEVIAIIEKLNQRKKEINTKKYTVEVKKKMARPRIIINSCKHKNNQVEQLDTNGNLIHTWDNASQISKYFNLKASSGITKVLTRHNNFYKGFLWQYKITTT